MRSALGHFSDAVGLSDPQDPQDPQVPPCLSLLQHPELRITFQVVDLQIFYVLNLAALLAFALYARSHTRVPVVKPEEMPGASLMVLGLVLFLDVFCTDQYQPTMPAMAREFGVSMTAMGYSIQAGLGLLQHPADSAQNVAICHMMQDTLRAMVLAVLITATKGAFPGFGEAAPEAVDSKGTAAKAPAPVQELLVPCTVVLRFYGRWDDEDQWVLLQSLPLQGVAGSVVNSLRRNFAGPLSKRLLTALVARSARGLVRRRGWKPIVEKTMAEVGREFHLGYLVELPSGGASKRIYLLDPEQRVEEVPSARILRDAVDANREKEEGAGWDEKYIEATIPEIYTDPALRFNRKVQDWGVEYTVDFGDPEEWRDALPKLPEMANFKLPDHLLNNSRRQLEEVPVQQRFKVPDEETDKKYRDFMDK
ncbi:unnamed protein product, partial [Effrenium voratum]